MLLPLMIVQKRYAIKQAVNSIKKPMMNKVLFVVLMDVQWLLPRPLDKNIPPASTGNSARQPSIATGYRPGSCR